VTLLTRQQRHAGRGEEGDERDAVIDEQETTIWDTALRRTTIEKNPMSSVADSEGISRPALVEEQPRRPGRYAAP